MKRNYLYLLILGSVAWIACEKVDTGQNETAGPRIELQDVARLLSEIQLGEEQLGEVFDAVSASSVNGYDEEYMMADLFTVPGAGVGDAGTKTGLKFGTKAGEERSYRHPMKEKIREALNARQLTKATDISVDEYLDALETSDIQIYWPYSSEWDGKSYPIITFAPDDDSDVNVGYGLTIHEDGSREIVEVLVDEALAMERPVWVINRNDDSGNTTIELMRRNDPDWGMPGGGEIIVGKPTGTKAGDHKMLLLKDFRMLRQFDTWFAGASEFWIKMGSADGFRASTEAELKLYNPSITDFIVVVQRGLINCSLKYNAVIVSDWTPQIDRCALLITEDDGGSMTKWDCSIVAKVASKSYGFEASIPFRENDDIVWRGSVSSSFVEAASGRLSHFGDVDMTLELVDY